MVQERINSKKQRQHRTNYCHENNIPDDEESFVISITIHSFFEAGYTNIVLNTENMFKEIHPDDSKKALSMSKFFDEVFSEIIK